MSFQEDQSMDFFGAFLNEMRKHDQGTGAKPWQDTQDGLSSAFVTVAGELEGIEIPPQVQERADSYQQRQLELEKSLSFRSRAKMLGRGMLRMFG